MKPKVYRPDFSVVSNEIFHYEFPLYVVAVYCYLCSPCDIRFKTWIPPIDLAISQKAWDRALKTLVKYGFLEMDGENIIVKPNQSKD